METSLGTLNYLILMVYLAGMLGVGIFFARKQENSEMFFLGGRKLFFRTDPATTNPTVWPIKRKP